MRPKRRSGYRSLGGSGERVFVVADEEGVQEFVSSGLREDGYVVFEASSV